MMVVLVTIVTTPLLGDHVRVRLVAVAIEIIVMLVAVTFAAVASMCMTFTSRHH